MARRMRTGIHAAAAGAATLVLAIYVTERDKDFARQILDKIVVYSR